MTEQSISRRQFLEQTAVAAGAIALAAGSAAGVPTSQPTAAVRTATDIVPLGNTGLKCTRLGLGLGSGNGVVQTRMGVDGFNAFIKHAFDQGVTMLDIANNYRTFNLLGAAIKGLPREKLFIQSKMEQPVDVLNTIDKHRKAFNTDYVDSMLVHVQVRADWTDIWKQAMDDFNTAADKKWILSKGVSCHSLPALRASIESDWTQVHLVRVNPQGIRIDNEQQAAWLSNVNDIKPVLAELKRIKEKQRGVIGMKIFGNGEFKTDEDREKSMRFAMNLKEIDSVIIGFNGIEQFDAGVALMNKVLAEPA